MAEKYLPTGNEYVSLPDLDEKSAALGSVSVLHMARRGSSSCAEGRARR